MSTRPPDDDGDFGQQKDAQILPLHSSDRRRRTSGKRLVDTPAPVQDWFDANASEHAGDVRLQVWLEEGLRDAGLAADATDPADHRQQISSTRLTEHPILIQEWFDATADAPSVDLRLRLFVDALAPPAAVPTPQTAASVDPQLAVRPAARPAARPAVQPAVLPPASDATQLPKAPEPRSRHRWLISAGLALAASTLLTVGLQQQAALRGRSQLASSLPTQTAPELAPGHPSHDSSVGAPGLAPVAVTPDGPTAVRQDSSWQLPQASQAGPTVGLAQTDVAQVPADAAAAITTVRSDAAAQPTSPTATLASQDATGTATSAVSPQDLGATQVSAETIAVPTSGGTLALSPAGELDATGSPWLGDVVPGLQLRLQDGFGELSGSHSSPVLSLPSNASVSVDLDRTSTDADFATFTIRTQSATVRVVGTHFSVSTIAGRTDVSTRHGVVQVQCVDGHRKLVSAGQQASCAPAPDRRLLSHMQALDRQPTDDSQALTPIEQYAHLQRLRNTLAAQDYVTTSDVVLARALADEGLRQVIESVRVDAMCDLGWEGPARHAAQTWLDQGGQLEQAHLRAIATLGCGAP